MGYDEAAAFCCYEWTHLALAYVASAAKFASFLVMRSDKKAMERLFFLDVDYCRSEDGRPLDHSCSSKSTTMSSRLARPTTLALSSRGPVDMWSIDFFSLTSLRTGGRSTPAQL